MNEKIKINELNKVDYRTYNMLMKDVTRAKLKELCDLDSGRSLSNKIHSLIDEEYARVKREGIEDE